MTKKQEFYNSFEDSDGELANRMYAEESPLVINKAGDGEHGDVLTEVYGPKTSTLSTFMIFFKSYLGSGIMAMAAAYLDGGVFMTTFLIYFVAILSCVCFLMLFAVRDRLLATTDVHPMELHYQRVVGEVLGRPGRIAVLSAVSFTQAGFATAYVIFIANNLNSLYPNFLGPWMYGLMQIPILVLLCWVRKLEYISPFAMLGTLSILMTVITVLYYCFSEQLSDGGVPDGAWTHFDWGTFPVAFGVIVYLFEGIGLILPLECKMKHRESFGVVMWGTHLSIATVVASFGLIGYLSFYLCTLGPITDNLPPGTLVTVTLWGLNVALLLTYPIQMFPVFEITEELLLGPPKAHGTKPYILKAMAIRAVIVALSVVVGIAIPDFNLFLSLIGGLGSAQLMFILPPITYGTLFWDELPVAKKVGCVTLFAFGIATVVITTTFTIIGLVQAEDGAGSTDRYSIGCDSDGF